MYIAVVSNVINVVGNLIGVFVLCAGVAGVAYPSLIARTFSAAAVTVLCFRKVNGVEQCIFQFVKVALSSIVALFGTYQIAANGRNIS